MKNLLKMYHSSSVSKIKHRRVTEGRGKNIPNAQREVDLRDRATTASNQSQETQIKQIAFDILK